ncbi:hypothetical protein [Streptomyces sp. WMMB 322]|uniref:hypothetical protein n=1 Tax=Streptomyces sp. WMMB 322 TaxID=1286821 RepID=UPI0006E38EFC|nr:hypothetical protein [Streptomyces sp. WMMB 322]
MRDRAEPDEDRGQEGHRTSTVERGAFCHARCSCGWLGPARRARDTSRADGEEHVGSFEGDPGHRVPGDGGAGEADVLGPR